MSVAEYPIATKTKRTVLDIGGKSVVGFSQRGQSSRKTPASDSRSEVQLSSVACSTCGKSHTDVRPLNRGGPRECPTCRDWRSDHGYSRPDELITKAAARKSGRGSMTANFDVNDVDGAMTMSRYTGASDPPPNCTCRPSCQRMGSRLHGGLSPYCYQLAQHRDRRGGE